jgi:hypothetical protein
MKKVNGHMFRVIMVYAAILAALAVCQLSSAEAQTYSPVMITQPIINMVDENHVSMVSGRPQFAIPALKLGDVSFTPYSFNGEHFQQGGLIDHNYGHVAACDPPSGLSVAGNFECSTGPGQVSIQAVYGEERATFDIQSSQYVPEARDGSTFVDNGSTCTWTKRDGTKLVYIAYRVSGDPRCLSQNLSSITTPDGKISTYYYYGSFSTTLQSPILSIATNTGYMLKYIYSGTPAFGSQTSVVAFNRAFQACDPAAVSCSLASGWPTSTLTWTPHTVFPCDGFPTIYIGYNSCIHYTFTIQDAAHRNHVFELDSYMRVISYQPPEATSAVYNYNLCSLLVGNNLRNCFGYTTWPPYTGVFQPQPLLLDLAESVTRNGQAWAYGANFTPGGGAPPSYSSWSHQVTNPLGKTMGATGNATPGTEAYWGPIESVSKYDSTFYQYERSVRNVLGYELTPAGIKRLYDFEQYRANLDQITTYPVTGSPLSPTVQAASYPEPGVYTCSNIITCNKPITATDANLNQTDFTYDSTHGGMLTETDPAVNGIRPQTRRTYVQRYAWYLDSSGTMTRDTNPVWLLATESYCRTSAASGAGCSLTNDETVTSYDYGPDSGPNNLILRGKAMTASGTTLRTCYAHDTQGNKIWETSPNANPASCPTY